MNIFEENKENRNPETEKHIVQTLSQAVYDYLAAQKYNEPMVLRTHKLISFVFQLFQSHLFTRESKFLKNGSMCVFNIYPIEYLSKLRNCRQAVCVFVLIMLERYLLAVKALNLQSIEYEDLLFHTQIKQQILIHGDVWWNTQMKKVIWLFADLFDVFNCVDTEIVAKTMLHNWYPYMNEPALTLKSDSQMGIAFEFAKVQPQDGPRVLSMKSIYIKATDMNTDIGVRMFRRSKMRTKNRFFSQMNTLELQRIREEHIQSNKTLNKKRKRQYEEDLEYLIETIDLKDNFNWIDELDSDDFQLGACI